MMRHCRGPGGAFLGLRTTWNECILCPAVGEAGEEGVWEQCISSSLIATPSSPTPTQMVKAVEKTE